MKEFSTTDRDLAITVILDENTMTLRLGCARGDQHSVCAVFTKGFAVELRDFLNASVTCLQTMPINDLTL